MMQRTKRRNQFLKQKLSILCKAKKIIFWGNVKPFFSNKVRSNDYITLKENDILIRNEYKIANIFNTCFVNIV